MRISHIDFDLPGLLGAVAFGLATSILATSRGRNAALWFLLGALFPCFGLILLLVLPDLQAEQMHGDRQAIETARLREQIRKDRQLADRRHSTLLQRMDVHDRALNVNTADLRAAEPMANPAATTLLPDAQALRQAEWYYLVGQQQRGPVPFAELKRAWHDGSLGPSTYVWCDGMRDWRLLRDLPALEDVFRA